MFFSCALLEEGLCLVLDLVLAVVDFVFVMCIWDILRGDNARQLCLVGFPELAVEAGAS